MKQYRVASVFRIFGSMRYDSAAISSIRYGDGSVRFSVVTLLKRGSAVSKGAAIELKLIFPRKLRL